MLLRMFRPSATRKLFSLPMYKLTTKLMPLQSSWRRCSLTSRMLFTNTRWMSTLGKENVTNSNSSKDEESASLKYESNEQLAEDIELYNSKNAPDVMHKIIKKICNSDLEITSDLKSKVPGLSSFCEDVSDRVLTSRSINPGFLEDCSEFFLYNYGASNDAISKLILSVWDNFEKCGFEALCTIFYYLSVQDGEMKHDITMLFAYRFLEFMIENEENNKFTYNSMVSLAEAFINFRIVNPLIENAFEKMLIKFFESKPERVPDVEGAITLIQLINLSSNTLKQDSNIHLWSLISHYMTEGKLEVIDLYNLNFFIKMSCSSKEVMCKQIVDYISIKNFDADSISEKLNSEHSAELICTLLENIQKIENKKFLECAYTILKNNKNIPACLSFEIYRTITKCKHFEEKEQNFLAMIYYEYISKKREVIYYEDFKHSDGFSKRRINRSNKSVWDKMFRVNQQHLSNPDNIMLDQ